MTHLDTEATIAQSRDKRNVDACYPPDEQSKECVDKV